MNSTANPDAGATARRYGQDERQWAFGLAVFALFVGGVALVEPDEVGWFDVALVGVPSIAFVVRGLTPSFPTWGIYLASMVPTVCLNVPELRTEGVIFLPILAIGHVAFFEPRRRVAHVLGATAVATPILVRLVEGSDEWGWQFWAFGLLFAVGAGEIGHRHHARLIELQETRALVADQALLDERRRIARDVHDLVGHSLAVVMLQVTAARELVRRDPDEAEAALDDAARVGRESLTEIRRTLGLLRNGESDGTVPSPLLTDVDELVDEYRTAGLRVEYTVGGDPDRLDRTRSIAGYRIVQEALANASKHAAAGTTSIAIAVDGQALAISVRSPIGNGARHGTGGYGLVGMQERAASVGGTVRAGPQSSQWVVEANLPRRES